MAEESGPLSQYYVGASDGAEIREWEAICLEMGVLFMTSETTEDETGRYKFPQPVQPGLYREPLFFSCSLCSLFHPTTYSLWLSSSDCPFSLGWTSCVAKSHSLHYWNDSPSLTLIIQSFVWHLLGTRYVPGLVDTGDTRMNKVWCLS